MSSTPTIPRPDAEEHVVAAAVVTNSGHDAYLGCTHAHATLFGIEEGGILELGAGRFRSRDGSPIDPDRFLTNRGHLIDRTTAEQWFYASRSQDVTTMERRTAALNAIAHTVERVRVHVPPELERRITRVDLPCWEAADG